MATSRIKTSSVLQGFPKSRSLLAGNAAFIPGDYESIATVIVGSGGTSTVTFSSIPGTYAHLQIRGIARLTGAFSYEEYAIGLNSDTGSNYSYHYLQGQGSATSASGGANTAAGKSGSWVGGTSLTASVFGTTIFDILDYADTSKYTTIRMLGGMDSNGSGYVGIASSLWRNTAVITSITLDVPSDFAQYSKFALYGIRD